MKDKICNFISEVRVFSKCFPFVNNVQSEAMQEGIHPWQVRNPNQEGGFLEAQSSRSSRGPCDKNRVLADT